MSDTLRQALRTLKAVRQADMPHFPVTYLHDPETLLPYAALVDIEAWDEIMAKAGAEDIGHSHREGDEDER